MIAMVAEARVNLRFILAYGRIAFRNSMVYRADVFIKFAGYPARLIVAYFLWKALFENNIIQGYGFQDVVCYYILVYFITQMYPFIRMARDIREEIYSGDVLVFMVRGVPHWAVWLGRFLATAVSYVVLVSPVAILLLAAIGHARVSQLGFAAFIALLFVGLVIKGQLWYLIGISTYFTEENLGTIGLYTLVEQLLSGAVLPLSFFPDYLTSALKYLPFSYTLYVPTQALLRPPSIPELWALLGIGIAWSIALGLLIKVTTIAGWRRFTAHGT